MRRALAGLTLCAALIAGPACRSNGERSGPAAPSPQTGSLSHEVVLAPGESTRVEGLTVTLDGVSADSRCPTGVQCIWEGDAVVLLKASEPSRAGGTLELHTAARFAREGTYGRYRIALVSLVPHPREGEPVVPDRYRATLRVSR